jgi:hypothetical protein
VEQPQRFASRNRAIGQVRCRKRLISEHIYNRVDPRIHLFKASETALCRIATGYKSCANRAR